AISAPVWTAPTSRPIAIPESAGSTPRSPRMTHQTAARSGSAFDSTPTTFHSLRSRICCHQCASARLGQPARRSVDTVSAIKKATLTLIVLEQMYHDSGAPAGHVRIANGHGGHDDCAPHWTETTVRAGQTG